MSDLALQFEQAAQVRRRLRGVNVPPDERTANTTVGAAVIMYAARRRGLVGLIAATVGAGLIARGTLGRCPIYRVVSLGERLVGAKPAPSMGTHVHPQ